MTPTKINEQKYMIQDNHNTNENINNKYCNINSNLNN